MNIPRLTPDQFLTFAQVLPESLLLVTGEGGVLAVNQAAAKLFGKSSKDLIGKPLGQLVIESPEKVIEYLRACSQSRQLILGALTITQEGTEIPCRSQGSVVQPRSSESPAIVILRLEKRKSSEFTLLNQKIHALSQEIQQRQRAQLELAKSNETLQQTLVKLQNALASVQTEKMSGLGQLVAGIAHEINNPISFVYGNLKHASDYYDDLLRLIHLYQQECPHPSEALQQELADIDLDFLKKDITDLLRSMRTGAQRVTEIVQSLRNFSRLDEADSKMADVHEGLEATVVILQNRLAANHKRAEIELIRQYSQLPAIHCSPGQLNQVFMNLLNNAIDALEEREETGQQREPSRIWICTEQLDDRYIAIRFKDNGGGIPAEIQSQIFNPLFTTKSVGKGTGLGLAISYQIVGSHNGRIEINTNSAWGTEFIIELPICKS